VHCALRYLAQTVQQERSRAGETERFRGDEVLSAVKGLLPPGLKPSEHF
jgi:hypothetical protein